MRIGIDLGGTKIEAIALDDAGEELVRHRTPTPRSDYDGIISAIVDLVVQLEDELGATATVGVGHPGSTSPATGLIKNSNSVCLIGQPLDRDLEQALGRPVRLENDANCFLLSECLNGSAKNSESALAITLGTGIGGAFFANDKLHSGLNGFAAEIGHVALPSTLFEKHPDLPKLTCGCGKKLCLETLMSGSGLIKLYQHYSGTQLAATQILADYENFDSMARKIVNIYMDVLTEGVAIAIMIFDPEVIVFGGSVANFEPIYGHLKESLGPHLLANVTIPKLEKAVYGSEGGARGAALLSTLN